MANAMNIAIFFFIMLFASSFLNSYSY